MLNDHQIIIQLLNLNSYHSSSIFVSIIGFQATERKIYLINLNVPGEILISIQ